MFDPTTRLNHTITEIKPSGIRKFFDLLDEMKDVVALTVGQPDFVTPWHIRDAGIRGDFFAGESAPEHENQTGFFPA